MSDGERGPYTPGREAPLQFDPRGARDAKPMPMALIASAVVLVVLVVAVAMAYMGGSKKTAADAAVGDRVLVMKTPPAPGANPPAEPDAKLQVFSDRGPVASANPALAPAPEQPLPRPAPKLQVKPSELPPVRVTSADDGKPAAAASPAPRSAAAQMGLRTAEASTAAPPVSKAAAASKAEAAPARPAAGGVGVQIGAFSSETLAEKGYADVGKLVSTAGHGRRIEAVERGGSTLYRTTVTGFADRETAKAFCAALTAKGHACIVKG
jgi:hypothetical protein